MNGLISGLLAQGAPWEAVFPLLLLIGLILFVRATAAGIATVIKAMHPGHSADAVRMQSNRIHHRQFKARRRDRNRRARRAHIRAVGRAPFHRCGACCAEGPPPEFVLPSLVIPPDEPPVLFRTGRGRAPRGQLPAR